MDLGAYAQIADIQKIAEANGINVPRLRGYRLMANEQEVNIEDWERKAVQEVYRRGCCSIPRFTPDSCIYEYSSETDRIGRKFIDKDGEFRWSLLHGKRRKNMKFAVKKMRRAVHSQADAWNRYAGQPDVLYIHARIGGKNWHAYGGEKLRRQPWFIEKVDDWFDETYCDIYARI